MELFCVSILNEWKKDDRSIMLTIVTIMLTMLTIPIMMRPFTNFRPTFNFRDIGSREVNF